MASGAVERVERGLTQREEFGAQQLQTQAETAMAAVAAREQAKIQAAYIMAERHPRSWDMVRRRMLDHCNRYGFSVVARYRKPVGRELVNGEWVEKYAEGLSTQFAQMARQEMGNVIADTSVVYEDARLRIIRATVVDYERNTHEAREIAINKTVEKKGKRRGDGWAPPEGRDVISERLNNYGEPVYLCVATDDEVAKRQNSEISKAHRDCTLRMIPKDIRDEAEVSIEKIKTDKVDKDPAAFRNQVVDAFAAIGVRPDDLMTYLGRPLDRATNRELRDLKDLWSAIKENEITFQDALKQKYETPEGGQTQTAEEVAKQKISTMKNDKPAETVDAVAETVTDKAPDAEPAPRRNPFGGGHK